jgi:hypothetical protein
MIKMSQDPLGHRAIRKTGVSDACAGLMELSVYLGPFYVPTPFRIRQYPYLSEGTYDESTDRRTLESTVYVLRFCYVPIPF